jgi:hypothetical protein
MEMICSYEVSVDFQRITRRYIPEDNIVGDNKFSGSVKVGEFLDELRVL